MSSESKISIGILILGTLALLAYWYMPENVASDNTKPQQERIILPEYDNASYQSSIEVQSYIQDVARMIGDGRSILPLDNNVLDDDALKAQTLVLKNKAFLEDTFRDNKPLHNDMMRILPAIISSLDTKSQKICQTTTCYQAEKYNFVTNATTRAIIDVDAGKVIGIERYDNMQPDISLRLTRVAQSIALNAPEVKKELGFKPLKKDMAMSNVRGGLLESPCENSKHLCVAPTFVDHKKEQALWAVVNLTELRLAAAKWAGLGKSSTPACISERTLQNRYIMENFCQKDTKLVKNGWELSYRLTGSDGLEVINASYKGKPILTSAKIVDWHVSYEEKSAENLDTDTQTYVEGREVEFVHAEDGKYLFGYNDAMGCPMFSTSVVLPFNGPQVKGLKNKNGFMLTQDYRNPKWPMACNYRYENRFEFYNDGSFRVVGVNKGRGCGDSALYRPVMRVDMALGEKENFYSFEDGWKLWEKEGSQIVHPLKKYSYKIVSATDENNGYYIEDNYGQFNDNSRGDFATLYVSRYKAEEGAKDLLTLGSCCDLNDDGMNRYLADEENIKAENLVVWYVPRIRNDMRPGKEYCWADTIVGEQGKLEVKVWPCTVGPKFVPIGVK